MVAGTLLPEPRMAPRRRRDRPDGTDPRSEPGKSRFALSAESRRQEWKVKAVREWREKMAGFLAELDAELDRADSLGLKEVPIDGTKKFENAEAFLKSCVRTVANGVNNARFG